MHREGDIPWAILSKHTEMETVFFTPATGQIQMKFVALEIRPATYRNASGICGVLIKYMFLS